MGDNWRFVRTELEEPITEFVVLLVGRGGGSFYPIGSGVFLTRSLVMTAKHVIEEFWRFMGDGSPLVEKKEKLGHFMVVAVHFPGESRDAAIWSATAFTLSLFSDIALISLKPYNELAGTLDSVKRITVNALPPRVGERISCIGYPQSSVIETDGTYAKLEIRPHTSCGLVQAVYPEYRDRGMLKFPCFEFESYLIGGMSGGPIFNEAGELCGLNCSSHDGQPISYGVSLWPIMGMSIHHLGPEIKSDHEYPVHAMAQIGLFNLVGWDEIKHRVYVDTDPVGRQSLRLRQT